MIVKNHVEDIMNLETLYNEYKNYTVDNAVFYNSNFSRKLNDAFSDYGLEQYMSLISPQEKESYSKDSAYTFTEKDIKKLGYFLGSATSRHSTRPGKYPSLSVLNPFLHPLNREKMGISDLEKFTDKYIENGKTIFDLPASFTYPKIKILIWFAKELKKCTKRLIIASFYMKTFNGNTFNKIISRLNDFVDELYLVGEINDFSEPSRVYCGGPEDENDFYHSIDVLAAADTCDYIYHSRTDNQDNYLPLVPFTNIDSIFITPEKSYRDKLKETIAKLYENYVNLLFKGYEDVEIC